MLPGTRGKTAAIGQLLFGVAVLDAKAHSLAVSGCEIHVLRGAVTEVEQSCIGAGGIRPVSPQRNGHLVHIGNLVRQQQVVDGAVHVECLLARGAVFDIKRSGAMNDIEVVVGSIGQRVLKLPLGNHALRGGRLSAHRCRDFRLVLRLVDSLDAIVVGHSLPTGVVDIVGSGHLAGDGVPLPGALLGTQHHIAGEVFLCVGRPAQADRSPTSLCRQPLRLGRSIGLAVGVSRQDAPHLET